ncbi:MAG: hypothetical protein QFX40_04350 [Archaeoglobales archaeon]|nr:hypothetical protein [Archaeoglobales archaeon]
MNKESFEKEIREIFDEDFIRRTKALKKSRHIFNPIFYILFTRLVELSAILNEVVLPNSYEIKELFRTRKDFLQIDYGTLGEAIRRAWLNERKRGSEYTYSSNIEDLLYILYRIGRIQSRIDQLIVKHTSWSKESLSELYFTLMSFLIELDDNLNREIDLEK